MNSKQKAELRNQAMITLYEFLDPVTPEARPMHGLFMSLLFFYRSIVDLHVSLLF